MSLAGGDGITLHKITKYADIKRKKPVTWILIYLKCWDPDPDPYVGTPKFLKKRGLDVGRSKKWSYQHLGQFIVEF